jgi:asparagine synthase (glutamine-hydrolysing)
MTRTHVTVALTGDGGDEVFGGYGRHFGNRLAELGGAIARIGRRTPGEGSGASRHRSRVRRFLASARLTRAERYRAWSGVFSPEAIAALADGVGDGQRDVADLFEASERLGPVDAVLAVDTMHYLPTDLLPKMDITTMMHSLEARSPFLDRDLAEFAAKLPAHLKVRRLTTKYILKRALADVLPRKTLTRGKQGFTVPVAAWLRGELREFLNDHLRGSQTSAAGLVHRRAVDSLIDEHAAGTVDHAYKLWTLLMLELWHREFVSA